jgi:IS5 family transposase
MEEAPIEVAAMRRLSGIDLISDQILAETTVLAIRRILEKHNVGEQCQHRWTGSLAYGKKVHTDMGKGSGRIHSVVTTPANLHDLTPAANLLHGEDKKVDVDAGQSIAKPAEMRERKTSFVSRSQPCQDSEGPRPGQR